MATWRAPHLDLLESRLFAVWWAVATIQPAVQTAARSGLIEAGAVLAAIKDATCGTRVVSGRDGETALKPNIVSSWETATGYPPSGVVGSNTSGVIATRTKARSHKNSLRRVQMLDDDPEGMRGNNR